MITAEMIRDTSDPVRWFQYKASCKRIGTKRQNRDRFCKTGVHTCYFIFSWKKTKVECQVNYLQSRRYERISVKYGCALEIVYIKTVFNSSREREKKKKKKRIFMYGASITKCSSLPAYSVMHLFVCCGIQIQISLSLSLCSRDIMLESWNHAQQLLQPILGLPRFSSSDCDSTQL